MSIETILPISAIPWVADEWDFFIKLGRAENACWSLRAKWAEHKSNGLDYFEIHRTPSDGKVNMKISLAYCFVESFTLQSTTKTFESCIDDGQSMVCMMVGGWPQDFDDADGDEIKGSIALEKGSKKCPSCVAKSLSEDVPSSLSHLAEDLLLLLDNPDYFADGTLKCGSTEIPVHRSILSARSPVFAAMFKSKMKENQGVVNIVDIEANVLKWVLKYIYSGKTDPLTDEIAGDVLFAADKYQLVKLKLMCVSEMKLNTTVDNVSRMIVLGHLHDESLKSHAKDFVCKHKSFSDLEKTEGWKELEREYPSLAIDVLKSALEYAQKSQIS